jgi:hypothetical protein
MRIVVYMEVSGFPRERQFRDFIFMYEFLEGALARRVATGAQKRMTPQQEL